MVGDQRPVNSHTQTAGSYFIRRAAPGDATAILICLHGAFAPYRAQYTPEGYADSTLTPETIQHRLATQSVFVAADQTGYIVGTIGGTVIGHSEEGHIRGMAVLPDWHGTGVAEELLCAVEEHLRNQGCRRVTLDTTAPLQRAIRFYLRNGYAASGKVGDFYGMPLYEYAKSLDRGFQK
jgi:GNAT superfamily N-acetyltransferase